MRAFIPTLIFVLFSLTLACNDKVVMEEESELESCGDKCWVFKHDDTRRTYYLYLPDDRPANAPLLFVLHGYTDTAQRLSTSPLDLNEMAKEKGYVIVYPQGTEDRVNITHWNAELDPIQTETDDIGFLSELAVFLQGEYNLDPTRTFTSGISNGAFMSYTLACQAPEIFKGVGSVIGTMSGKTWETCPTSIRVPILQISGVDDLSVPIDGSMSENGGWGGAPHMDEVMERWSSRGNCDNVEIDDNFTSSTTRTIWSACSGGQEVWYYKVEGMGHVWPWRGNAARFSGAAALFEFFENI